MTSLYASTRLVVLRVQLATYMDRLKEPFGFVGKFAANFHKIRAIFFTSSKRRASLAGRGRNG
jgi:hypothetical protein